MTSSTSSEESVSIIYQFHQKRIWFILDNFVSDQASSPPSSSSRERRVQPVWQLWDPHVLLLYFLFFLLNKRSLRHLPSFPPSSPRTLPLNASHRRKQSILSFSMHVRMPAFFPLFVFPTCPCLYFVVSLYFSSSACQFWCVYYFLCRTERKSRIQLWWLGGRAVVW